MSAILLADEIVHYEVLGRGRPMIFLHGWVGSWRYWMSAMQAASISFRAYALDLWGFGDTAKNPEYYSLEKQGLLLDQFLERMGIGKAALVGHGLGAMVALRHANRRPADVDRLMIVGLPVESDAIHPRLRHSSPLELRDWLLRRDPLTEAVSEEALKADGQAIQTSLTEIAQANMLELALKTATPCLWVHGLNDPAINEPRPEKLGDLPEHAHYIVFEESAHFPMLDEPRKFNRLLADFLALDSGESPRQLQLKEEWKRRIR